MRARSCRWRFADRLDAHRLIEEFMVLANVAAAETLIARRSPLLFRVHEEPSPKSWKPARYGTGRRAGAGQGAGVADAASERAAGAGRGTVHDELINISTLRAMTQAYYSPTNFGHFGLALQAYAHFTSPIRRYSDLVVHRALISAHKWGPDPRKDGLCLGYRASDRDRAGDLGGRAALDGGRARHDRPLSGGVPGRPGGGGVRRAGSPGWRGSGCS
jgi:exoribonuclease R